ncbi:MAG TPA: hypothetical protein VG274_06440 [Rhizomicrobium sp.]|nr:hypothetical protein [Rhizomicrobium sp.]
MPRIHVCSLQRLDETVRRTGARSIVTLIDHGFAVSRPTEIAASDHLCVGISDIVEPVDGYVLPSETHVEQFLGFVRRWDRRDPMVIHCYAGVSRSTAAAFIAACALAPEYPEQVFATRIRCASPTATPNARLVALADVTLDRKGRMIAAIDAIGRGVDCYEGVPFALDLT